MALNNCLHQGGGLKIFATLTTTITYDICYYQYLMIPISIRQYYYSNSDMTRPSEHLIQIQNLIGTQQIVLQKEKWQLWVFSIVKNAVTLHNNEHRNNRENMRVGAEESQSRDGAGGILEKKENTLWKTSTKLVLEQEDVREIRVGVTEGLDQIKRFFIQHQF